VAPGPGGRGGELGVWCVGVLIGEGDGVLAGLGVPGAGGPHWVGGWVVSRWFGGRWAAMVVWIRDWGRWMGGVLVVGWWAVWLVGGWRPVWGVVVVTVCRRWGPGNPGAASTGGAADASRVVGVGGRAFAGFEGPGLSFRCGWCVAGSCLCAPAVGAGACVRRRWLTVIRCQLRFVRRVEEDSAPDAACVTRVSRLSAGLLVGVGVGRGAWG